jgi:hypothetical protein
MSFQLSLINYTVDAYLFAAASALAATIVTRSIFGAAFPVRVFHTAPGSFVLTHLTAFHTTNVRVFKSSVGVNHSWDCCRCHDSYPYHSPALWALFALEVQVRTECGTCQTTTFRGMNRKMIALQFATGHGCYC